MVAIRRFEPGDLVQCHAGESVALRDETCTGPHGVPAGRMIEIRGSVARHRLIKARDVLLVIAMLPMKTKRKNDMIAYETYAWDVCVLSHVGFGWVGDGFLVPV